MKKEIKHYNIDKLASYNADINILYGERSSGKSWQLKHKRAVIKYLETGKRFILMRRFAEEVTTANIEQYFQDVDIEGLTKGKYDCITVYRKQIYFAKFDSENFKKVRGEKIGYAVSLSTEQNYAGGSFLDVEDIIFEEFMTRTRYLSSEPTKLMNFYATIDRKRATTKLWLVGNSISRVCPYLYEWGLANIVAKQKQGTIETMEINATEDDVVKLAIEYCASTGTSSHTIGWNKNMMNDGSWQSSPQPHLPKSKKEYNILYRIGFMYQGFKFLSELLQDKNNKSEICWFIYPYEKEFDNKTVVFTDVISTSIYYQRNIYDITIKNDNLQKLLNTFREDKIFYANDLCGTDFKQVIDFSIKR